MDSPDTSTDLDGGLDSSDLAAAVASSYDEIEAGGEAGETGEENLSTEAETQPDETEDSGSDQTETDDQDDTGESPEVEAIEAPSDFTADEGEAFKALPAEAQKLIADYAGRSQQSRTSVATELDGLRKEYTPLQDTINQYRPHLDQLGVTPSQVWSGLMPYYARLTSGNDDLKREAIRTLARDFNIDLGAQEEKQEAEEFIDPAVQKLEAKVQELESGVRNQQLTVEQAAQRNAQAEIDTFKDAKDDKGALKHPHFEKLEKQMEGLIRGGLASTIQDAYEKARVMDPDIRAQEQKAAEEAKRKEADKKAAEAKKAASLNKSASKSPAKPNATLGHRESVEEAWEELGYS